MRHHGSIFINLKQFSIFANPILRKEDGPMIAMFHIDDLDIEGQWKQKNTTQKAKDNIHQPFTKRT